MRFNRLKDIGLTEDQIKNNLMFTTDKVGDVMQAHMILRTRKKWFGTVPPDLTLIARSRGNDYIYAYLRGFYKDPTRPTGWNNTVLPNAAMPHVFGCRARHPSGEIGCQGAAGDEKRRARQAGA